MKCFKSLHYLAIIAACLSVEVDARRKILKGRKTVTRTYVADSALPAWAYVVLIAFGELIAGGIIYLIMKKRILDTPLSGSYDIRNSNP